MTYIFEEEEIEEEFKNRLKDKGYRKNGIDELLERYDNQRTIPGDLYEIEDFVKEYANKNGLHYIYMKWG